MELFGYFIASISILRFSPCTISNELHIESVTVSFQIFVEPIGSVSPKITAGDDLKRVKIPGWGTIALLCPAMSFPVPVFR